MKLRQAHQILIGSAIALAVLFSLRSMLLYSRAHVAGDLLLAVGALVVAGGLGLYLRHIRAKWAGGAER